MAYEEEAVTKDAAEAKAMRARAKEQLGDKADKRIAEYLFGHNPIGKPALEATGKVACR